MDEFLFPVISLTERLGDGGPFWLLGVVVLIHLPVDRPDGVLRDELLDVRWAGRGTTDSTFGAQEDEAFAAWEKVAVFVCRAVRGGDESTVAVTLVRRAAAEFTGAVYFIHKLVDEVDDRTVLVVVWVEFITTTPEADRGALTEALDLTLSILEEDAVVHRGRGATGEPELLQADDTELVTAVVEVVGLGQSTAPNAHEDVVGIAREFELPADVLVAVPVEVIDGAPVRPLGENTDAIDDHRPWVRLADDGPHAVGLTGFLLNGLVVGIWNKDDFAEAEFAGAAVADFPVANDLSFNLVERLGSKSIWIPELWLCNVESEADFFLTALASKFCCDCFRRLLEAGAGDGEFYFNLLSCREGFDFAVERNSALGESLVELGINAGFVEASGVEPFEADRLPDADRNHVGRPVPAVGELWRRALGADVGRAVLETAWIGLCAVFPCALLSAYADREAVAFLEEESRVEVDLLVEEAAFPYADLNVIEPCLSPVVYAFEADTVLAVSAREVEIFEIPPFFLLHPGDVAAIHPDIRIIDASCIEVGCRSGDGEADFDGVFGDVVTLVSAAHVAEEAHVEVL